MKATEVTAISHVGDVLRIDGRGIVLDYPIEEAFGFEDKVIVLFNPDCNLELQRFNNLVAFDQAGRKLWVAELPTSDRAGVYYRIASRRPLKLLSFSSYECEIDPQTGRVLSSVFFK